MLVRNDGAIVDILFLHRGDIALYNTRVSISSTVDCENAPSKCKEMCFSFVCIFNVSLFFLLLLLASLINDTSKYIRFYLTFQYFSYTDARFLFISLHSIHFFLPRLFCTYSWMSWQIYLCAGKNFCFSNVFTKCKLHVNVRSKLSRLSYI